MTRKCMAAFRELSAQVLAGPAQRPARFSKRRALPPCSIKLPFFETIRGLMGTMLDELLDVEKTIIISARLMM